MRPLFAPFSAKAALTVAAMIVGFEPVIAVPLDVPMGPQSAIQHIEFETPTLPLMAYTVFCLRYQDECRARPLSRAAAVRLTDERWADIKQVNQTVTSWFKVEPRDRRSDKIPTHHLDQAARMR